MVDKGRKEAMKQLNDVFIVDGARTPFLKARGRPGDFSAVDLAVYAGKELLLRQLFSADEIDEVILGCVSVPAQEVNPGRVAALRLGCGAKTPGWTVQRNCASGMQSIDTAYRYIAAGGSDIILAGGTDALSRAPLQYSMEMSHWFAKLNSSRGITAKLKAILEFRPRFLSPSISLLDALVDPYVKLGMGQTAEILAYKFGVTREEADNYALESHNRLAKAQKEGFLNEIAPIFSPKGVIYDYDDGVRAGITIADLSKLKPVFEKPYGQVTAGNSSQITDGASWVILASEQAIKKHKLKPLARIIDSEWAAIEPEIMGLGPVISTTPMLNRHKLKCDDIDLWEINEAFAAQVLSCLKAWVDQDFCRDVLGLSSSFGEIDQSKLNIDGGAISLGHPVGASGNRIVLHLIRAMQRNKLKLGVATECIGGGMGGAMLIEAL